MFTTFLQHVPTWVFGLLFALIAFGVAQSFPRSVSLRRSAVLPLVLVGLSLMGVVTTFGQQPLALLAWAAGLSAALLGLQGRIDTSAVRFSADTGRFQVPGSWLPLALMMVLFAVKFGVGALLAMRPDLRSSMPLALLASAAYGLFSGVFGARAMALWTLTRQPLPQAA